MNDPNAPVPSDIRAHQAQQQLELIYSDLGSVTLGYHEVRAACPCAVCQNEWTGERILDPASIPKDIRLHAMDPVGSYAIRIRWSEGHATGIFNWSLLRQLAEQSPQRDPSKL